MYLQHFGLEKTPFKITPDTNLFFEGSDRGAILSLLNYAVEEGEGITKVIGEVGTGKTMLCRMLMSNANKDIHWLFISAPSLSPDEAILAIAYEMKLPVSASLAKFEIISMIHHELLNLHIAGKRVVLLVEEAQSTSVETLEEIRLLSNLETHDHKLIQIILFGQPELNVKLKNPEIRQLNERIIHSIELESLSLMDVKSYLNFRMRSVGYKGPEIFDDKISKSILKYSYGLTRRINLIADKILLTAFNEKRHNFTKKDVKLAALDYDFSTVKPSLFKPFAIGAPIFVSAIAILSFMNLDNTASQPLNQLAPHTPLTHSLSVTKSTSTALIEE